MEKICICRSRGFDPYLNLAAEEVLTEKCGERFSACLFLWRNDKTVVLGKNQNPYSECDLDALALLGGKLARRKTGGGAVYHDCENLNFSFIRPPARGNTAQNHELLLRALASLGVTAEVSGRNDLVCEGRKFSGNAFFRTRTAELHHGTLLLNTDVAAMTACLGLQNAQREDKRAVASVRSRVVNLCELYPALTVDALADALESEFCGKEKREIWDFDELCALPRTQTLAARNASFEWLYGDWKREIPTATHKFAWGRLDVFADGNALRLASDSLFPRAVAAAESELNGKPEVNALTDEEKAVAGEVLDFCLKAFHA